MRTKKDRRALLLCTPRPRPRSGARTLGVQSHASRLFLRGLCSALLSQAGQRKPTIFRCLFILAALSAICETPPSYVAKKFAFGRPRRYNSIRASRCSACHSHERGFCATACACVYACMPSCQGTQPQHEIQPRQIFTLSAINRLVS